MLVLVLVFVLGLGLLSCQWLVLVNGLSCRACSLPYVLCLVGCALDVVLVLFLALALALALLLDLVLVVFWFCLSIHVGSLT